VVAGVQTVVEAAEAARTGCAWKGACSRARRRSSANVSERRYAPRTLPAGPRRRSGKPSAASAALQGHYRNGRALSVRRTIRGVRTLRALDPLVKLPAAGWLCPVGQEERVSVARRIEV
jgi:hypothetical protein